MILIICGPFCHSEEYRVSTCCSFISLYFFLLEMCQRKIMRNIILIGRFYFSMGPKYFSGDIFRLVSFMTNHHYIGCLKRLVLSGIFASELHAFKMDCSRTWRSYPLKRYYRWGIKLDSPRKITFQYSIRTKNNTQLRIRYTLQV